MDSVRGFSWIFFSRADGERESSTALFYARWKDLGKALGKNFRPLPQVYTFVTPQNVHIHTDILSVFTDIRLFLVPQPELLVNPKALSQSSTPFPPNRQSWTVFFLASPAPSWFFMSIAALWLSEEPSLSLPYHKMNVDAISASPLMLTVTVSLHLCSPLETQCVLKWTISWTMGPFRIIIETLNMLKKLTYRSW